MIGSELKKRIPGTMKANTGNVHIKVTLQSVPKTSCHGKAITYSEYVCGISCPAYTTHVPCYMVFVAWMALPYFSTLSHK
jgi:hypothetical protein